MCVCVCVCVHTTFPQEHFLIFLLYYCHCLLVLVSSSGNPSFHKLYLGSLFPLSICHFISGPLFFANSPRITHTTSCTSSNLLIPRFGYLFTCFIQFSSVAQSCLTLCDPMNCSPPGFSVHGLSRQEYWSGLPFPSPGDLPDPGIEPGSPTLEADALTSEPKAKLKEC